jgi:hypothetical protein
MTKRVIGLSLAALAIAFGATVFASSADAQRSGVVFGGHGGARPGLVHPHRVGRFFPGPLAAPYFYPDYDAELDVTDAPQPEVVLVQPQTQTSAAPAPAPESLVLELQGDYWVRITNYGESQSGGETVPQPQSPSVSKPLSAASPASSRQTQPDQAPTELPTAVLVFRDGHKEEIGKYMVMGLTIHVSADYWSNGSWTRDIQIAELDVPATLKLNQQRGAKFSLPSGPNEVMIRP